MTRIIENPTFNHDEYERKLLTINRVSVFFTLRRDMVDSKYSGITFVESFDFDKSGLSQAKIDEVEEIIITQLKAWNKEDENLYLTEEIHRFTMLSPIDKEEEKGDILSEQLVSTAMDIIRNRIIQGIQPGELKTTLTISLDSFGKVEIAEVPRTYGKVRIIDSMAFIESNHTPEALRSMLLVICALLQIHNNMWVSDELVKYFENQLIA